LDLLSIAGITYSDIGKLRPEVLGISAEIQNQLKRDALYANYIDRQKRDVEALRNDEAHSIPQDFDFNSLVGLSNELRQKLQKVRPATLGQAGRVEGMTPAALTLILARLRQRKRSHA
ncbi:MAG: tRNA uridine-5-carboxymethylaminomethyl(34) synthesis enzyme MnmG, partial [Boseongicola sp.]